FLVYFFLSFFFFTSPATSEIYTLSLHDALPIFATIAFHVSQTICWQIDRLKSAGLPVLMFVDEPALCLEVPAASVVSEEKRLSADRKSTRLNSSHDQISYAVFCLKKKKRQNKHN